MKPFAALYDALCAAVQSDAARLRSALGAAPHERIYAHAVRHKCAGVLFDAMAEHRIRERSLEPLWIALRRYAAACTVHAADGRAQIGGIVRAFTQAGVPYALLKSARGLYAGHRSAEHTHVCDIDVLVPRAEAARAAQTLVAQQYRYRRPDPGEVFPREHHHLVPMVCEAFERPVEIHVQAGQIGWFSTPSDWNAFEPYLETVPGPQGDATCLNAFGRCLSYALHGTHLLRISDVVNVAIELRRSPALLDALRARTHDERIQRVGLESVVFAAAEMAALDAQFAPAVRRFAQWAIEREDVPRALRDRAQLVDAYYANGGRVYGFATRLAMQRCRARAAAGRIAAGAILLAASPLRGR